MLCLLTGVTLNTCEYSLESPQMFSWGNKKIFIKNICLNNASCLELWWTEG